MGQLGGAGLAAAQLRCGERAARAGARSCATGQPHLQPAGKSREQSRPFGASDRQLSKGDRARSKGLRNTYALAQAIERQGEQNSDAEFQQMIQKIVAAQPDNVAALLELCRVAAKRGDAATLQSSVARMAPDRPRGLRKRKSNSQRCKVRRPAPICAPPQRERRFCATCSGAFPSTAWTTRSSRRRLAKTSRPIRVSCDWSRPYGNRRRRTWHLHSTRSRLQAPAMDGTGPVPSSSAAQAQQ